MFNQISEELPIQKEIAIGPIVCQKFPPYIPFLTKGLLQLPVSIILRIKPGLETFSEELTNTDLICCKTESPSTLSHTNYCLCECV